MSKQYGHYLDGGCGFCITEPDIPRNWYNYLWNDTYITYFSQVGAGESFMQDNLGRRIKLVADRGFFITEGERHFGIAGLPVDEKRDGYRCVHSHGRTDVYTDNFGISSRVSIIVPREGNFELWSVKVKNNSDETRSLKVIGFMGSAFDSAYARQGYNTECSHCEDGELLYIKRGANVNGKRVGAYGFLALNGADSFSGAYNAIVGPYLY